MYFKKIAGPMKLTCLTGGGALDYPLPATPGGRLCKSVQFMVKVLSSSGTTPKLG